MFVAKNRPLWSLTQGHRGRYAGAILAMALANFFLFCVPLISQAVIDGLLIESTREQSSFFEQCFRDWGTQIGKNQTLLLAATSVILLTSLGGLSHYLRGRYAAMASEGIVRRVRDTLYKHLAELPLQYHDKADTGDLLQRASSDVETIRVFLSDQVVEIAKAVLLLVSVLPILIWLDERMALFSVVLFPPILIFAYFFFGKVKSLFLSADEAEGEMTAVLQENLTGIRVVRAFARQDFECDKFGAKNQRHRDRDYKLLRYLAVYWSVSDFLCLGQIGIVLVAGAHYLSLGQISLGVLSAFLTYIGILIWPVRHLGRVLSEAGKALVALQRLNEVLEQNVESQLGEPSNPFVLPPLIELKNVSFSYETGGKVIDNLSFNVQPGETLAILGPTGAGKSTLIRLLMRLYDVTDGQIFIDGQDIAAQSRRAIRAKIGVVLAEAFLFSKSVIKNLSFGRKEAPISELEKCANDACIAES
ncbi:MAG: ABC transporter transmembrane domain-containing protein, partial [Planctomycetota bacterium]|nr:ABC transporter transmembrane domain-containing protein [Planctomycetota bacterium]